jgi:predicted DNA-binding transcriptional regulator YafY
MSGAVRRGRQVVRQWEVLRALERARRGLTVQELAEIIDQESSLRTVYRDLDALEQAGFAIASTDGRWRLERERGAPLELPIKPSEVLALMVGEELARPLQGTAMGDALTDLRIRLGAMLTPTGRLFVQQMARRMLASHAAPGQYGSRREQLEVVEDAIYLEQVLSITYARPGDEARERKVEPYATWLHEGRLYLVAWCRERAAIRIFSVLRIEAARMLDETFEPDPTFDLRALADTSFGVYQSAAIHRISVRFEPSVAHLPRERTFHASQRVRAQSDGSAIVSFEASGLPEVAGWVASFGGRVRPLAPPELIEQVRAIYTEGLESLSP